MAEQRTQAEGKARLVRACQGRCFGVSWAQRRGDGRELSLVVQGLARLGEGTVGSGRV